MRNHKDASSVRTREVLHHHTHSRKAFVTIGDLMITSIADLKASISNLAFRSPAKIAAITLPKEHVFPSDSPTAELPTAVLYGAIGARDFAAFDAELRQHLTLIRYVVRHLPPTSERRVSLQGWSAELALKNMEYKAVDDSQAAAQEVKMPGDEEEGVVFTTTTAAEEVRLMRVLYVD